MSEQLPAIQQRHELAPSGFFQNINSLDSAVEAAKWLSKSTMVPDAYQGEKGIPNLIIAMELGARMGMNILTVTQNLDIIQGRPAWSARFQAGQINASGRYRGGLAYEFEDRGEKKVEYEIWQKDWQTNKSSKVKKTATIKDRACRCWAISAVTGERVNGPWFSLEMALRLGLYDRSNSQWPTDPENMLMKRAVSRFAANYCPEVTLGLITQDEAVEIIDVTPEKITSPPLATPQDVQSASTANDNSGRPAKNKESAPAKPLAKPQETQPKQQQTEAVDTETGEMLDAAKPDDSDNPF